MRIPTRRVVASLMVMMAIAMSGLPGAPSPVRAAGSITALAIDSEPGDNVGQGQQLEYAPPTATFSVATFSSGWTFLQVLGAQGGDFWNLSFAAADSGTLTVGTYENAQRSADATHPGLDVGGQGRGCNTATGRFVISEIERDLNGNVTTLALAFEQHCEGGPAALFGEVRYQASTGYELLSVAPTSVDLGSAGIGTATLAQTVHLTSIGTVGLAISGLSIDGTNAADFAIVSETCPDGVLAPAASCEVTVKATPTASGERTGRLVVDNDTFRGRRTVGLTATGITPVSAVALGYDAVRAELQLQSRPVARPIRERNDHLPARDLHDRPGIRNVGRRQRAVRRRLPRPDQQSGLDVLDAKAAESIDPARLARVTRLERQIPLCNMDLHVPLDRLPGHGAARPVPAPQFEPRRQVVLEHDQAPYLAQRSG
jgi:hypothetical protein